jgi:hypothetical protein
MSSLAKVSPAPSGCTEFGKGSAYAFKCSDQWTRAQWFVHHATQTYRLFVDGREVKEASYSKGPDKFAGTEIPEVFETLSFGRNNCQNAGQGFLAWIDDIALATERIGARGLPAPRKP